MNTNLLKKFAQEARKKLLEQVSAKLSFVLSTDSAELREKTEQLKQLREALTKTTKEQLIEKVAYTWFNRLMALRFMDANDYQPIGIRVITPKDGYTIPEILDEAKRGSINEDLKVNRQKVYDLLDNKIPSTNPQNEAFKELLIAACNQLHTTFPFLFEKINDYTELLIPDDLTSDFSIVTDVRNGMPVEDCKNVEIIGWLYQFYISEKKDEVFASKAKVKKEDIPAATQLFTPRWIVEYMVQNTLGKLWLQNRPKSKLREHMPYFIESASVTAEDYLKINSPEEIKFADPASGSGHILVYAFDLFTKIYEEEGYSTADIPKLIIEKNLYGFEIDERAAQLSGLALMMKAREYQRRAFKKDLKPNILCFQDLQLSNNEIKETFETLKIKVSDAIMHDLLQLQQATNFGSLIIPHADIIEINSVIDRLNQSAYSSDVFLKNRVDTILNSTKQLFYLSQKYHCISANPPYMGGGKMNPELSNWVMNNYPNSKADLITCFIERCLQYIPERGFSGLVTMESWMFLSSFEIFRKNLLETTRIHSLSHFGWHIMRIAFGTVSFILEKKEPSIDFNGTYSYMEYDNIQKETERPIEFPLRNNGRYNVINQKDFEKIPSSPIGYWIKSNFIKIFEIGIPLKQISPVRQGLATMENTRFVREWFEVAKNNANIPYHLQNLKSTKWQEYNKGGNFQKWYGNREMVVNWKNDGEEIKKLSIQKYNSISKRVVNEQSYFNPSITYSKISSRKSSFRYQPEGAIFDVAGMSIFFDDEKYMNYILGFLNTNIAQTILEVLSPTLNFEGGQIGNLPIIIDNDISNELNNIIESLKTLSKLYWDSHESSWDFMQNEFIRIESDDLKETSDLYQVFWENKFNQLHKLEESINTQFINIYELKDIILPTVLLEDITILKEETTIENGKLVFNPNEVFAQFISYSVGCMFGRYSLDKEGLILANQGETLQDYLQRIDKLKDECNFLPDEDNIIPILDNEWFEDDIVGRFYQFLKVTFGEPNFNKNIAFIEEQMGMDMRKYFTKEFYPDHIKRYKKRPIYWMFSSPKGSFNALIYMHRYTTDTVSNILNKYLKEYSSKLRTRNEHLQHIQVSGSPSEKTKALKESDSIDKILVELQEYERDILYPLATDRISIDLDDGVLVNYNKFGKAVKEIGGLNDKKTKDKVRKFDWIDTTQIR